MLAPGAGCTSVAKLVQPGDELIFSGGSEKSQFDVAEDSHSSMIKFEVVQISEVKHEPLVTQCVFNAPLPSDKLEDLSHKNFYEETLKKVKWVTKMYHEWHSYMHNNGYETIECDLDDKKTINYESLTFALSRFLTKVKKVDGSDFPGKTLYDILICVQFHLETLGFCFKLLTDNNFASGKYTLDNLMKLRTLQGIGVSVKKAQVLTATDEDFLWSIGLLGTENPDTLLNTVVFRIGKGFAL